MKTLETSLSNDKEFQEFITASENFERIEINLNAHQI